MACPLRRRRSFLYLWGSLITGMFLARAAGGHRGSGSLRVFVGGADACTARRAASLVANVPPTAVLFDNRAERDVGRVQCAFAEARGHSCAGEREQDGRAERRPNGHRAVERPQVVVHEPPLDGEGRA